MLSRYYEKLNPIKNYSYDRTVALYVDIKSNFRYYTPLRDYFTYIRAGVNKYA